MAAGLRAGVVKLFEPAGRRLDRWRRGGVEPERDLSLFLENLLILAFVAGFVGRYRLPVWAFLVLAGAWMLHLPRDFASLLRNRSPTPASVHRRGFFFFHYGPLPLRVLWGLLALGVWYGAKTVGVDLSAVTGLLLETLEKLVF